MSKLNIGTMLILSILLVSPLKPNGQPAYDRINMSASKSLRLYFYPALSDLDEKTFTLRTNRMILSITSSDANFSFSGVMMYGYQNDPSETRMYCTRIGNYSSSGSHWYSNSYSWNDSGFAFYDRPYPWHLFYTGTFPWDAYHWPIIIGTDLPLTSSDPLQDLGNFPLELTSKWAIDAPRLLPLEGAPNNDTLERLWPGFYARLL